MASISVGTQSTAIVLTSKCDSFKHKANLSGSLPHLARTYADPALHCHFYDSTAAAPQVKGTTKNTLINCPFQVACSFPSAYSSLPGRCLTSGNLALTSSMYSQFKCTGVHKINRQRYKEYRRRTTRLPLPSLIPGNSSYAGPRVSQEEEERQRVSAIERKKLNIFKYIAERRSAAVNRGAPYSDCSQYTTSRLQQRKAVAGQSVAE